jgi:hypothetical protein
MLVIITPTTLDLLCRHYAKVQQLSKIRLAHRHCKFILTFAAFVDSYHRA